MKRANRDRFYTDESLEILFAVFCDVRTVVLPTVSEARNKAEF